MLEYTTSESAYFGFTYFLEPSPSWEANLLSASQEIPLIVWNITKFINITMTRGSEPSKENA